MAGEGLWEMLPIFLTLGFFLGLILWVVRRGDPISRFARTNFKMKLDKKTGMFWAKPKGGIKPPGCCPECRKLAYCNDGKIKRPRLEYILVNCPKFEKVE